LDRRVIYLRPARGGPIDQQIGARLARLRVRAGLTLGEMAARLDVSIGRMVLIETGDHRASPETLRAACSVLEISIGELYAGLLHPTVD